MIEKMSDRELLENLYRMSILNFLELQEMRDRLNIKAGENDGKYDFLNRIPEYIKNLDVKTAAMAKQFPHLWPEK